MQPLINGEAYSWSQITVNVLGREIAGITAVKYDEKQEIEDNKGAGTRPVSRGYGSIEATASVTLHMVELEELQSIAPEGNIMRIPEFDITVSYLPENGNIVNHTIHNCRFMSNMRDVKQGDKEIATEIELKTSHISWV